MIFLLTILSVVADETTPGNSTAADNATVIMNPKFFERKPPNEFAIEVLKMPEHCPKKVRRGDEVEVTYKIIRYVTMEVVDETTQTEVFVFRVGYEEVRKGIDKGMLGMCVGERRRLTLPPEYAYGRWGAGEVILPNDTIIVEVELTDLLQRDWSEEYKKRVKMFEEDTRATSHIDVYMKRRPIIRPKRYRLTIPQEGLELKATDARKRIKGMPYRNWDLTFNDDAKYRRKKKWRKRERAWAAERNRTREQVEKRRRRRAAEAEGMKTDL